MFLEEVRAKRGYEALEVVESAARARAPVELANGLDDLLAEALPAVRTPVAAPPTPSP